MPDLIIRMSLDHARTSFDRSNLSRPSLPTTLCACQLPCEDVILVRTSPNLVLMTLHNFKFLRIFLVQTQHFIDQEPTSISYSIYYTLVFLDFHINIHFSLKKTFPACIFLTQGATRLVKAIVGRVCGGRWRKPIDLG